MRIALFSDTFDEVNGVANTLGYLCDYAEKKGVEIDFFIHAPKQEQTKNSLEKRGKVRIYRFKAVLPWEYYNGLLVDLVIPRYAVLKAFSKKKYDLIHTATPGSMGLTAAYLAKQYRLPMIGVYHTAIPEYIKPMAEKQIEKWMGFFPNVATVAAPKVGESLEKISREMVKWYYDQCELVLAPSQYFQEELRKWLTAPVEIFTRGVDTEKFKPLRKRKENHPPVALYVGRVSVEKNLQLLLPIFAEQDKVKLQVVGDGPFREEMQSKLARAEFSGFLRGQDLVEAYSQADFFVFPSRTDTFGNVILEAMSCGLPVIVSDQMAPKELVQEGKTGFICSTEKDFADKIKYLAEHSAECRRMGKAAYAYALSRRWSDVFDELWATYKKTVKTHKKKLKKEKIKKIKSQKTQKTEKKKN